MTYKGVIDEVKSLANNSLMPVIFKPSLKKIAEALEMERPKEFTLSEVETYANEHNYVLWTDEMSEKALALIKAVRNRPKGEWILDESDNSVTCNKCGCGMYLNDILNGEGHFCPNCGARMKGGE